MKTNAICRTAWTVLLLTLIAVGCASVVTAAEHQLVAPGGGLKVTVSDEGGLNYWIAVDGKTVLTLILAPGGGFAGIINQAD